MKRNAKKLPVLTEIYQVLRKRNGDQHWWPGDSTDEVIIGAILTQSVAWGNVEKCIANLKEAGIHKVTDMLTHPEEEIASLIRPSLYFNQKARRLRVFAQYLEDKYQGDLAAIFKVPVMKIRAQLLALKGLGPETVDSILLYAGGLPVFVVDAYTDRLLGRLGYRPQSRNYKGWQMFITSVLSVDVDLYKDFHAQIDVHCKEICKKIPRCGVCVFAPVCPEAGK